MSALPLLALCLPALAGPPTTTVGVDDPKGVEAEAVQAALAGLDLSACREVGAAPVEVAAKVLAAGGDVGIIWGDPAQQETLGATLQCTREALVPRLQPVLGGRAASARLSLRIEAAPAPPPPPPLSAAQAAAGLSATISRTEGVDGPAAQAAVLARRTDLGACYTGPPDGGRLTLNVDWDKKEQFAKLAGYTSGMEETGACAEGVLRGTSMRESAAAKKTGRAAVELVFRAPE